MGSFSQAEYDLLMLEINERSIRFLDAKPAVRNFFMRIDSIYYERNKSPQYNSFFSQGLCENDIQQQFSNKLSRFSNSVKLDTGCNNNNRWLGVNKVNANSGSFKQSKLDESLARCGSMRLGDKFNSNSSLHNNLLAPNAGNMTLTNVSMSSLIPFQVNIQSLNKKYLIKIRIK